MQLEDSSRFVNLRYLGGTTTEIYHAYDQVLKQSVVITKYASDHESQQSETISKLYVSQIPLLLDRENTSAGIILVFASPSPEVSVLLMEQSQYTAVEVERFGSLLIHLLRDLKSKGLLLTEVNSEDILVDRTGNFNLINLKHITQWSEQDAALKRAQADAARLMIQMRLGCDYHVIRHCVAQHNGQYHLHRIPHGLDQQSVRAIKRMFESNHQSPSVSTTTYQPLHRRGNFKPMQINTKIIVQISSTSLAIFCMGCIIGGPVYLVKSHLNEKARRKEVARQEELYQRRLQEEARRRARKEADQRRNACITAIKTSTDGDCTGQDLTGIDASNADLRKIILDNALLNQALLNGATLSGMNLSGVSFTDAQMRGADLSLTTVTDVNWNGSDLMNANLSEAKLENADFSQAHLGEADLTGADISHANFSGINLSNQTLVNVKARGTTFHKAYLRGVIFSGGEYFQTNFNGADLTSTVFTDGVLIDESSFSEVILTSSQFRDALVYSTTFMQATLSNVLIETSEFSGTSFLDSILEAAQFSNSVVVGGRFTNSDLRGVIGEGTSFRTMDFEGTQLSGAMFVDCDFYRAAYFQPGRRETLRNVVLPDGSVKNPSSSSLTN